MRRKIFDVRKILLLLRDDRQRRDAQEKENGHAGKRSHAILDNM
jgi:hypothetical protein